MDNLDILVKSLNRLENYTAKYIYNKYIEIEEPIETIETIETIESIESIESIELIEPIEPIEPINNTTTDDEDNIETISEDTNVIPNIISNIIPNPIIFKYSKKPINKEAYKLYKDRIFSKERKNIITQDEVLTKDLENMTMADKEYDKNPNLFNRKKYNSYPDEKRCTYIRKIKHKLIRCKNSIINDDEDVCSKHEDTPNIYWDMYNDLLEK